MHVAGAAAQPNAQSTQYVQSGRQKTIGWPSIALRRCASSALIDIEEDQRRVHACEQRKSQQEGCGCAGGPADDQPSRED